MAITNSNVMNKLSFVVTEKGLVDSNLAETLMKFRKDTGAGPSNQSVKTWCDPDAPTNPSRRDSFVFLRKYIERDISVDKLNPDQKKVFRQVRNYILKKIQDNAPPSNKKLDYLSVGREGMFLRHFQELNEVNQFKKSWVGWYRTYRYRLLRNEKKPFACEVVRISRVSNTVRYQHWHQKDGMVISIFEGGAFVGQNSLWMVGASKVQRRLRVCHFNKSYPENPVYNRIKWGLMHSDMPSTATHEPSSTRILMVKMSDEEFAKGIVTEEDVKYVTLEDIPTDIQVFVKRMVPNKLSAKSLGDSLHPADLDDYTLRVDQDTLQMACTDYDDIK